MKTVIKIIDNNKLEFQTEDELDTKVLINGTLFCWISFPEMEKFVEDFSEFMAKYRI